MTGIVGRGGFVSLAQASPNVAVRKELKGAEKSRKVGGRIEFTP